MKATLHVLAAGLTAILVPVSVIAALFEAQSNGEILVATYLAIAGFLTCFVAMITAEPEGGF